MLKQRGFTLIELMIIVAIVLIVAAVVIPQVFRERQDPNRPPRGLKEFTLKDGTRCIHYYGNVHCHWEKHQQ